MSQPTVKTLEREADKLYLTDAELIRRLGVPEKIARQAIQQLDKDRRSGFPQKQKLWGDRRYWPAVSAYLDRMGGLKMAVPQPRMEDDRE